MTLFSKWAVAGLLLLPNALQAAFVPSAPTTATRTTTTSLYATINATETRRNADPFLNNFLDGPSQGSRFVRYDRSRDKANLVDTSTDDFINKYNSDGLGRKATGGNSNRNSINKDGSVRMESIDGTGFSSNKFERYDKKKFGNLILGQENNNDDFINKKNPTQSSIQSGQQQQQSSSSSSSYPQHLAKKQTTQQPSSSSTIHQDGVELKRFNRNRDKSLFSSSASTPTPSSSSSSSQNTDFVQDPRMAAAARRQPPPQQAAPNESRIPRERQENVKFPRTPSASSSGSSSSSTATRYPSNNDKSSMDWLKQREQRGGQELAASASRKPASYPTSSSSSSRNRDDNSNNDWMKQREERGGQELSDSVQELLSRSGDWFKQRQQNRPQDSRPAPGMQMPPVQFDSVHQAPPPPPPQPEDNSFQPGRFVTRSGADVSQHITEPKGRDSVVGSVFSVSERKPVRPESVQQSRTAPVRPTTGGGSQRKPVMPAATPSLKRDFYRSPEQQQQQQQQARTTTYTAQPPERRPVRPNPPVGRQQKDELSDIDARVLRDLLQTEDLDPKTEAALRELLHKERSAQQYSSTRVPKQQEQRRPTMPQQQQERRPSMPQQQQQERRPTTPQAQERRPAMPEVRKPTMPSAAARSPTMPSSASSNAIPRRRPRPAKAAEVTEEDEIRKTRQKLQAERNREALLQQYNAITDEEMILYGMKVSGNHQVDLDSKTLPPPPKYGWNEYGIEDGFMNNYQEYHSFFEQQEQKQAPTLKEPRKAAPKAAVKESDDQKDPREGSSEGNEWVDLGDPRSPGFAGFSDSEYKLQGGDSPSVGSSYDQWWKRNDWDQSQEVVITDYAGDDYQSGSVQPQKPEPKVEEQTQDNSDGGIPKPKAPGFVGFSNTDWSQQR